MSLRDDVIAICHQYRLGRFKTADDAADQILALCGDAAEKVAEAGYISCEPSFERGYRQASADAARAIRSPTP